MPLLPADATIFAMMLYPADFLRLTLLRLLLPLRVTLRYHVHYFAHLTADFAISCR